MNEANTLPPTNDAETAEAKGSSVQRLVSLPVEQAYPLELSTGATTLFFGRLGSNTVWGFAPPGGKPGVAITDGRSGQAVVNLDNLRELVRLMEANDEMTSPHPNQKQP